MRNFEDRKANEQGGDADRNSLEEAESDDDAEDEIENPWASFKLNRAATNYRVRKHHPASARNSQIDEGSEVESDELKDEEESP